MGQNKFLVQKILGWKIFADLKKLGSKENLIKKSFESNKFLVKNMFGPKIEVHNFWVKKSLGQTDWSKNCLINKMFLSKQILVKNEKQAELGVPLSKIQVDLA